MGWCSGTDVFDAVAQFVLSTNKPEGDKVEVLKVLINALEDQDWDCQEDSSYYDDTIVRMAMRELHPAWFETGFSP